MGEKEPKKTNNQIQIKIRLKTLIILITVIVLFLSANVFASVMGQGNIFFLIKNLVTTGKISGKDELLSDREITISYSSIDIDDEIKLQINKMVLTKEYNTLYMFEQNKSEKTLSYKLYDFNEKLLGTTESKSGKVEKNGNEISVETRDTISEDDILILKVFSNNELLRTIKIDLSKREITVEGKDTVKKISEVELKKYLGHFALLKFDDGLKNDMVIKISRNMAFDLFDIYELKREGVNEIAKSFYEDNLLMDKSVKNGKEVLKTDYLYKYSEEYDEYETLTDEVELPIGKCINIENIEYSNGIYSIDFVYGLIQYSDTDYEQANYYKAKIKLELNKNSKYSKYKIVSFDEPEKIKDTSETKEQNLQEEKNSDRTESKKSVFDGAEKLEYHSDIKNDDNGKIALLKLGENELKTEDKGEYYIYRDEMFDESFEIKEIQEITSEYCLESNSGNSVLFECKIKYISKDNKIEEFSLALAMNKDFTGAGILGVFDRFTGTTRFVRTYTDLYSEDEEESEEL